MSHLVDSSDMSFKALLHQLTEFFQIAPDHFMSLFKASNEYIPD